MKKASWIHWAVAIILVGLAGYSAVYIHRAEEKNALKVERQAKLDKQEEKRKKELLREQKSICKHRSIGKSLQRRCHILM